MATFVTYGQFGIVVLLCCENKCLQSKTVACLVNCIFKIIVSIKSSGRVFGTT